MTPLGPHDARLAPAACAAWLAAASTWLGWGWWPMALGALVASVAALRRSVRPALIVAIVAGLAGALAGAFSVRAASPVADAIGSRVTLNATALSDAAPGTPGPTMGLWRVELSVAAVDGAPARAVVVVWGGEGWSDVVRGQRVIVRAGLDSAEGGATALAWRPELVERGPPRGLDAAVATLRGGLRDATVGLPERLGPLTRGMVIGDDSGMDPIQREQLSRAGLTHLTAVSGSHFAIVLVAVTSALRTVLRSRRVVAAVTGCAMGMLVCLVFPEPSVVRAATMAGAICCALWWGRPAHALPALCAGVAAVAIVDPRLASEPGFAMSVAAVAAIALWAPALATRLSRNLPAAVAHPLAVCATAQLAVLPLLAIIGAQTGVWSVAANLAAGWCAAPVTLIGLAALALAPLSPGAAHLLATASGWCAWPVDASARAADSLPGASLAAPQGIAGALSALVVLALAIPLTFATRVRLQGVALAGLGVLVALAAATVPRLLMPPALGDWLVVACDVGQGDAMLLRSGPRSAVVIDVGPADGAGPDCLRRYGVARIDLLVITHPHADHEGALDAVLAQVPVAAAWLSPAEPPDTADELAKVGVTATTVRAGDSAVVGDVRVVILAPRSGRVGEGSTGLNDASVVTLATVQGTSVLGLGDLEHDGQRELDSALGPLVVDVVKVPHHGSDRQEPGLAGLVTARLAIVSVGAGNTYGHPAPSALSLWGSRASVLVRTDQCGDIVITPGPALAAGCPTGMAG